MSDKVMSFRTDYFSPRQVYHAYDADGTYKGMVKLTPETRERYEAKGFTFRNARPPWKER